MIYKFFDMKAWDFEYSLRKMTFTLFPVIFKMKIAHILLFVHKRIYSFACLWTFCGFYFSIKLILCSLMAIIIIIFTLFFQPKSSLVPHSLSVNFSTLFIRNGLSASFLVCVQHRDHCFPFFVKVRQPCSK